ncbi:MAG: HlyD family efflux transporter periplasmic adaptor subunit [Paludibacteraceae bacterium]|nr:HlyD family efflux transporter periplasmic adaptor subunit [Paludibacteraceae bacterium]
MDKIIEKKQGIARAFTLKALPYWGGILLIISLLFLLLRGNKSVLRVNPDTLTISEVIYGEFNDYIRLNGQVQPMTTIQISPLEGGVVQEIIAEEGAQVKAGDRLLVLSNDNLDLQILNSEAELAEKENILRNTLISMEQQKLSLEQERLQLSTEVQRTRRTYEAQLALFVDSLIAREEYLRAEEDYQLASNRLQLVNERAQQDSLYRSVEIEQMQESLHNMRLNMQMIRRRKENLTIKAPIDGELGLLDVVLGQSVSQGVKIGQINSLGSYKIEAQIDEHYIDRVVAGLEATFERRDEAYSAVIRKVYPEVRNGKFKADLKFVGEQPANVRSGQTYYLNLQLGQPEQAVLVPRGAFFQTTGGRWIYVLDADGEGATRREIRISRQNPQYYEVLEGLSVGEKVIVSGYEKFGDNERLKF